MNICSAVKKGAKENKALVRKVWKDGSYVYHGMDNILYIHNGSYPEVDREYNMSVAEFLRTDWQLSDKHPYHGPLSKGN